MLKGKWAQGVSRERHGSEAVRTRICELDIITMQSQCSSKPAEGFNVLMGQRLPRQAT